MFGQPTKDKNLRAFKLLRDDSNLKSCAYDFLSLGNDGLATYKFHDFAFEENFEFLVHWVKPLGTIVCIHL